MRNALSVVFASALLTGTVLPSYATDVLGGLIGGDGDRSLATLNSGQASDSGLVNVGLGGDNGNVVDINVGGDDPAATANISTGNGLTVDANVGGTLVDANASIGGGSSLVDAEIDLLNGNAGVDANVGGSSAAGVGVSVGSNGDGSGGNGGGGSGAGSGGAGGTAIGIVPGLPVFPAGSGNKGGGTNCVGESPNSLAGLINSTRVDASWMEASNVAIKPVMVCPEVRVWLSSQLTGSGLGSTLRNAVASDALISTSLSRSSYGADRVFAVRKSGSQLTVFVY